VLVTEVSRSDSWTNYQLSEEIEDALSRLWETRKALIIAQSERGVEFMVLPERWEHQQISALVEQWAEQVDWSELLDNTSLDEGDLVRIFRRTLDFLSQIPHVPYVSAHLQQNAKAARQLIDRFPINETVD
jgi:superfamily II RNA helicase